MGHKAATVAKAAISCRYQRGGVAELPTSFISLSCQYTHTAIQRPSTGICIMLYRVVSIHLDLLAESIGANGWARMPCGRLSNGITVGAGRGELLPQQPISASPFPRSLHRTYLSCSRARLVTPVPENHSLAIQAYDLHDNASVYIL